MSAAMDMMMMVMMMMVASVGITVVVSWDVAVGDVAVIVRVFCFDCPWFFLILCDHYQPNVPFISPFAL